MPFGLCSAPSVFQNCMNAVLGDVRHCALAFVDDIIVFSETFEDHVKHLEAVFERLRKANLRLKISKCEFVKKKLNYLGHVLSDDGISVDSSKVSVVPRHHQTLQAVYRCLTVRIRCSSHTVPRWT